MRACKWWVYGTALVLGWSAALATASDEDGTPARRPVVRPNERPGLIDKLFDFGPDTTAKKTDKNTDKKDAAKKPENTATAKPKASMSPEAAELAREQTAFQRRVAVCDRLREIAIETNDPELDQLAQELNARAWAVYKQRTAKREASPREKSLDEQILDKKLGIDLAPEEPAPAMKSNSSRNKGERTQATMKEEDR
jgi:hypothetical protein